ncbi:MAG: autotransporter-associated beta strand repeat-containing protein [Thermoguttaceae bacterium]
MVHDVTFNISGCIIGGGANKNLYLTSGSTSTFTIGGGTATISTVLAGTAGFAKAGDGLLILNCANTYTGTTTIGAGTLAMRVTNGLGGTTTGSTVSNGGSLAIGSSSAGGAVLNEALTINGSGYGDNGALCTDVLSSYNYDATVNGLVTLGSDSRINCDTTTRGLTIGTVTTGTAGYALTVGGAGQTTIGKVWGAGSLTKDGSGTLMITGATTHTGGTTINNGTVQFGDGSTTATMAGNIANNSNLVVATGTASIAYTGQLTGTGTLVHQGGSGMLRLGGTTSNTYTGLTTVSSGILQLEKSTALGSTSGSTNVANGASLYLNMNGGAISEKVNLAGRGYTNRGALRNVTGTNTWNGDMSLTDGTHSTWITCADGRLTINGNITLDPVGYWSDDYGQLVFSDNGPGDEIIVNGNITGGTTAWSVSKTTDGATGGTLTLAGNNDYRGSTEISRGVLRVQGGLAIPDASVVAFDRPSGIAAVLVVAENEKVGSLVSSSLMPTCNGTVQIETGANLTIGGDNCTTRSRNYFGLITGSGSLTKEGAGRQILGGDNSGFTGDTFITEGTLTARSSNALGTGDIKVYGANAVLETGSSLTTNGDVILSAGTIAHACVGSSGTMTVTGSGTVTGYRYTLKDGVFGASLGGNGTLTKLTNGTVGLTCSSPGYTGKAVVSEGTLVITQDSALGAAPASAVSDQLTLNGGTLRLARGVSNITLVNTGGTYSATAMPTASLSGGGGEGAPVAVSCGVDSTAFTFNSSAPSHLGDWVALPDVIFSTPDMPGGVTATGSLTYTTAMVGTTTVYTITGVTVTNPGSGYTETPLMWVVNGSNSAGGQIWGSVKSVKINGAVLPAGSGYGYTSAPTVTFDSGSASATASLTPSSTTLAANRGVTLGSSGGTIETDSGFNATVAGTISGDGGLTKTGSGTLTMTAANTYTGDTTLSAGTLQLGDGTTNGSVAGNIATVSGTSLVFNNASTQSFSGSITGEGAVTKKGAGTLTFTGAKTYTGKTYVNGGKLQLGNGSTNGSVAGDIETTALLAFDNSTDQTYGGVISGTGDLKMNGNAVLTLTGANTFTGTTTVASGTLQIGNGGTTGSLSSGAITVESGATLAFNRSNAYVIANTITGAGSLSKLSTGTLTLTGANNYTGTTTVGGGTLQIGAGATSGTIGTGNIAVSSGAILKLNRSDSYALSNAISGAGSVVVAGGGTLTYAGTSTLSGTTSISSSTLQLGDGATNGVYTGTIAIGSTATLLFNNAATQTFNGVITGTTGTLSKNGNGTLTLLGTNTYSGTTRVLDGKLQLGNGSSNGSVAGNFAVSSGALLAFDNKYAQTYSGAISGANGDFKKYGEGMLTLTGSNTYSGDTTITGGTLCLSGSGSINSTSSITLSGGALIQDSSVAVNRALTFTSGTLGGTGTYSNDVTAGTGSCHFSPGDGGIGTLTLAGDLSLNSTSVLDFDFGTTSGSCDRIAFSGTGRDLVLDGTINITCSGTLPGGDYVIFSNASSIIDNGLVLGTHPSGHNYTISVDSVSGTVTVTAAPEPGAIVMLVIGLAGLATYVWRKKKDVASRLISAKL